MPVAAKLAGGAAHKDVRNIVVRVLIRVSHVAAIQNQRLVEQLGELDPVDVVFDPVGGQLFADSLKLLAPLGVAIAIGYAGGPWQPLDPALLVGRNIGVQGFYFGRYLRHRPDEARLDVRLVALANPIDDARSGTRFGEQRCAQVAHSGAVHSSSDRQSS